MVRPHSYVRFLVCLFNCPMTCVFNANNSYDGMHIKISKKPQSP